MMNRLTFLPFALLILIVPGCGGGGAEGGKPVFEASGTVTMFGKPLSGATVAFAPQGDQPTAFGTTEADGTFVLTTYAYGDGAAEGNFKVVVSKSAPAPTLEEEEGADHDAPAESHDAAMKNGPSGAGLVPVQYTTAAETPFTAEVKSGADNVFTFDIK